MPDPAGRAAKQPLLDLGHERIFRRLALEKADLDELVLGELPVDLRQSRFGQSGFAEVDERFQAVRQTAQSLALGGGEGLHRGRVYALRLQSSAGRGAMMKRKLRGRTHLPAIVAIAAVSTFAPALLGCFSTAPGLAAHSAGQGSGESQGALGSFEVASVGAPPGRIAPASCVAGDRELFLGADLVDPGTKLVVRLVIDPLDGPALRIYDADAPFDRSVLFFREDCATFELDLEPTGWIVNDIVVRRLELKVDCENETGATIRGSASAGRCD